MARLQKCFLLLLIFFCFVGNAQIKESLISKDSLDQIFNKIIDPDGPPTGILLLGKSNNLLYNGVFGYADIENKRKADMNTQFNIASISKSFTALAVMQLVEQNKIAVSDTLGKFFPNIPKGEKITIHQLLTHTSGLSNMGYINRWLELAGLALEKNRSVDGNSFQDFLLVSAEGFLGTDEIFNLIRSYSEFSFEPGAEGKWEYSNRGYNVLAKIVEKVSGMKFKDYLRQNIFVPIGMKDTFVHEGILEDEREIKNYAACYVRSGSTWRKVFNLIPGGAGDGNVYTTLGDWNLYEKCLNGEMPKVISNHSLKEIFGKQVKAESSIAGRYYGYGWFIFEDSKGGITINHTGGNIGVNCIRTKVSRDGLTIVIFSTVTPFMVLTQGLWNYLFRNGIVSK